MGFLLVALGFLLPFVSASCDSPRSGPASVTYSAADLVAHGNPHLALSDKVRQEYPRVPATVADSQTGPVPVQRLLLAALVCAVVGLGIAGLRRPWPRALANTAVALLTTVALSGGEVLAVHAVRRLAEPETYDMFGEVGYFS